MLHADPAGELIQGLRRGGTFMVNSSFSRITTRDETVSAVDEGIADLVAVGRPAIANPDLVTRWQKGADENEVDQPTVYGGDEGGYTDYPFSMGTTRHGSRVPRVIRAGPCAAYRSAAPPGRATPGPQPLDKLVPHVDAISQPVLTRPNLTCGLFGHALSAMRRRM